MKRYVSLAILASAAVAITACQKTESTDTTHTTSTDYPSDNTKMNARDRSGKEITPIDQGNDMNDLETTANIRKALVADSMLSLDAKNAKVITNAGVITLRGPVKDSDERARIMSLALAHAGANRVDDQLEVLAPR